MLDPYRDPVHVPQFRSLFGGLWTDLNNAIELIEGKLALGIINQAEAQSLLAFVENGYAILRGAVDETLIDRLNADVDNLVADKPPPEAWVSCMEDGQSVTRQMTRSDKDAANKTLKLLDLYSFLPSARDVIFSSSIVRFLNLLFQRPVLSHQSLFFFKGSQQPIHRDTVFVRVSSPMELVASWTALEDIQPGSGELVYYPKSHLLPEFLFGGKYKWFYPGSTELGLYFQHLEASAKAAGISRTKFVANKGDVLIWSADLAHGGSEIADPNLTRRSIAAHYCPLSAYPMYFHYDGPSDVVKEADGIYYCSQKKVDWRSG